MKKKILTLVAMATLVTMMTACGSTEQTTNSTTPTQAPTVTTEPTEVPEEPTVTVEPTEAPVEPTEAPTVTVEPTEVPEVTPTETPVEPTEAPTEAPEVTVEPTEVPEETPEVTETPTVNNDLTFTEIVDKINSFDSATTGYAECEAFIETLDKSRYEVTAEESLYYTYKDVFDEELINEASELVAYSFNTYYGENEEVVDNLIPTGEYYYMYLTDTVTNETTLWGIRVHATNESDNTVYVITRTASNVYWMLEN